MFAKLLIPFLSVILIALSFVHPSPASATSMSVIYSDHLGTGWINWSWNSQISFTSTAINFSPSPWGALYLHNDTALSTSDWQSFQFTLQPTQSNQKFIIIGYDGNNQPTNAGLSLDKYGGLPIIGSPKTYTIPLTDFNSPTGSLKGFAIQEVSGLAQPTIYLSNLELLAPVVPLPINLPIYSGSLTSGWQNWSWGGQVSLSPNLIFAAQSGWGALYLHNDQALSTQGYLNLTFQAQASDNNEKYGVIIYDQNNQPLSSAVSLDNLEGEPTTNWKNYTIPLTLLNAQSKLIKGLAIQQLTSNTGTTLTINSLILTNSTLSTPTSVPTIIPSASPSPQPIGYTTGNGKIYHNGQSLQIRGLNWFGFETGTHTVQGLWARNWHDLTAQIKSLGFNAVRLPVCPGSIHGVVPTSIDYSKNPDLVNLNSLQILDKVVNDLNSKQIYILLDHHTPDCQAISELWYTSSYSESEWISDLTSLATRYKNLDHFLGLDLKNEPHGQATWGTGNTATDWNLAAERAGQALLQANPNLVVFVEGIGNTNHCSSTLAHFDGENLEPYNCTPISILAIPTNKLVLSPHIYGPDVYMQPYFSDSSFPANMPSIWDTQFGNLITNKGLTLIPGEWGGKYGTSNGSPLDTTLQNSLVSYLQSKHICSSFYWDLNPNSTDTGGILEDDWTTPWPTKLSLITNYFNNCY